MCCVVCGIFKWKQFLSFFLFLVKLMLRRTCFSFFVRFQFPLFSISSALRKPQKKTKIYLSDTDTDSSTTADSRLRNERNCKFFCECECQYQFFVAILFLLFCFLLIVKCCLPPVVALATGLIIQLWPWNKRSFSIYLHTFCSTASCQIHFLRSVIHFHFFMSEFANYKHTGWDKCHMKSAGTKVDSIITTVVFGCL